MVLFSSFKIYAATLAALLITSPCSASTSIRGKVVEREPEFPIGEVHLKQDSSHLPSSLGKDLHHEPRQHSPPSNKKKINEAEEEIAHHDARDLQSFQSRIVGGSDAAIGAYSFMASWSGQCGGSLIAPNLVLTAAHCLGIDGDLRIGSDNVNFGGEVRRVSVTCRHPSYDPFGRTTDYDYLLLKFGEPVDTSEFTPIQLNTDENEPDTGDELTVIGFGLTSEGGSLSSRLQEVQVPANSNAACRSQYGAGIREDIHLCAGNPNGGEDSCQGDSGGPIFQTRNGGQPVQVGVVSFGEGCARPNRSGVYAKVSGATDWIETTMGHLEAGGGCNGAGGIRDATCENNPAGWYDAEGPHYDCNWYAQGDNCQQWGGNPQFTRLGVTANQACCICGGGRALDGNGNGPVPAPTPPQVNPVSAPVPVPTPPTNDASDNFSFGCFSGNNLVEVQQKGTIKMKDLQIGDAVKVANNKYEPVYSFGHYDPMGSMKYLVFNKQLEASGEHLLSVKGRGFVPASTIKLGDHVLQTDNLYQEIRSISTKTRNGIYAPFTASGTVVVSGVLASCFISLQEGASTLELGGMSTGLTWHWISRMFEAPRRRLVCNDGGCIHETYTAQGISKSIDTPFRIVKWILAQQCMEVILLILLIPLAAFNLYTEASNSASLLLVLGVALVLLGIRSARLSKQKTIV